mgnify:CR=1 FL=1
MAKGEVSFPKIANSNWWKLRDLFKKKVPAILTPTYLASALSMEEKSAYANLYAPFKKIGIIDDGGKPTDQKYPNVCKTLIEKYYPQEVRDLYHSPDDDLTRISNWFMNSTRCGEPAANMYAKFYLLLLKADINEANNMTEKKDNKANGNTQKTSTSKKQKSQTKSEEHTNILKMNSNEKSNEPDRFSAKTLRHAPELHINIQLHISPETSADQIDKIFESMSKHLKEFK